MGFKVGDVCIWWRPSGQARALHGVECTINEPLKYIPSDSEGPCLVGYGVVNIDGEWWWAEPAELRLKRPPFRDDFLPAIEDDWHERD